MVHESDLQTLLIDDEAKRWYNEKISPTHGFLWDWDDEEYPVKESRFFLKFLLAYDADARAEYLKKRRQNDATDAPDENFDENFLKEHLAESRKQGVKIYAKKVAALYFCFDKETLDWYRNTWLNNDDGWSYIPERDDACLGQILATASYRVKTPEIVETLFHMWVLPFVGATTFLRANKYGEYNPETFYNDIFQRLFGRAGGRKLATNSIDYWLQKKPCNLRDWIRLETLRELERILKQLQRARWASIFLTGELEHFPAKPARSDEHLPKIDAQGLFDSFYAEAPADATLCAAYWSNNNATFKEMASFYSIGAEEKMDTRRLNKRYERALQRFKKICERSLNIAEIPEGRWKKVVKIFLKSDEQPDETNEENEASSRLKGTANVERLNRVQFKKTPTKEDEALLIGVLEARRCDDTGCFARHYKERMQGGGSGFDSNVTIPVRRRWLATGGQEEKQGELESPYAVVNQNSPLVCGSPVLVSRTAVVRRYWRNKYAENSSIVFYFESATEAFGSEAYWRAEIRCPFFAASDAEIGVVISGYDTLKSGAVEIVLGEKKVNVVHGVAVFKLADFCKEIERNAPRVTILLRCVDGPKGKRWHVKRESVGRLLYRKPVVRDDE